MSKLYVVSVDSENSSEEFWAEFRALHKFMGEILKEQPDEFIRTTSFAAYQMLKNACTNSASWNNGPDYAPNPLIFRD